MVPAVVSFILGILVALLVARLRGVSPSGPGTAGP